MLQDPRQITEQDGVLTALLFFALDRERIADTD